MQNNWQKLREKVHQNSEIALKRRLQVNTTPSDIEWRMGAFVEEIEEQVRDAVISLIQKGYTTDSSGFCEGGSQVIDGEFMLDEATVRKLKSLGVVVSHGHKWTEIRFLSQEQDVEETKKVWSKIVEIIPGKGHPAEPSMTSGAEDFRKKYKNCHDV